MMLLHEGYYCMRVGVITVAIEQDEASKSIRKAWVVLRRILRISRDARRCFRLDPLAIDRSTCHPAS